MNNMRCVGKITSLKGLLWFILNSYKLFFALIGGYWLVIEVINFFFSRFEKFFQSYGWWGILIIFILTMWLRWPISYISERLDGRDVIIEIRIGDYFETSGDYIISSTTSFDTSLENETVSRDSLLGKFIVKYFTNNSDLLTTQIEKSLSTESYESLSEEWRGNKRKYGIGTVCKINLSNRNCYLVGINNKNKHGNVDVHNDSFEDVKVALSQTWEYIEKRGDFNSLVIALMGTGRGRVKEKRIDVAKEIIKSFIAANSSSRLTNKLTIVIHPTDSDQNINVIELAEFLRYQCKYTQFSSNRGGSGIPISPSL